MERYPLPELIRKWEHEAITIEQVLGQILLWLLFLVEQVSKLEFNQRKMNRSQ